MRLGRAIDEAQRSYGWVAQYRDRSATELEVRMALHALDGKPHKPQFYYLREPSYVHEELDPAELNDHVSEGSAHAERLAALKADVEASAAPCRRYPRPSALAADVQSGRQCTSAFSR